MQTAYDRQLYGNTWVRMVYWNKTCVATFFLLPFSFNLFCMMIITAVAGFALLELYHLCVLLSDAARS